MRWVCWLLAWSARKRGNFWMWRVRAAGGEFAQRQAQRAYTRAALYGEVMARLRRRNW